MSSPSPSPEHLTRLRREGLVLVGPGRLGRTVARWMGELALPCRLVGRGQAVPPGPITWLTVPDRALEEAARAVPRGGVLLHASGARDLAPLRPHAPAGSLHPLMTFPGPELGLPERRGLPAAVAGDPEAAAAAEALAGLLGFRTFTLSGDRALYHAAAVMAGNFATTLLAEASAVLSAAGVPASEAPGLLAPLALQSLRNAAAHDPRSTLTGPVARGDAEVIAGHQAAIRAASPAQLALYQLLLERTLSLVE